MTIKKPTLEIKNGKRKPTKHGGLERKLRAEIARLRAENAELKKNLVALLHEDIPFDKNMLNRPENKRPSIVDVVAEMASRGN